MLEKVFQDWNTPITTLITYNIVHVGTVPGSMVDPW